MNIKQQAKSISHILKAMGTTPRIHILLGIGTEEACVCHLESILGWRQAYISQHLMALRKAEILTSRKEGRFVYYRLRDPRIFELIERTAQITGVDIAQAIRPKSCSCPSCNSIEERIPFESV